jgi:outer membrane protein assembly factor BamE
MIAFGSTPIKATHRPLTWAVWMCLGLCFLVSGCETASRTANRTLTALTPYRFDVVQGNFVAKEQVQLLQKGMSRRQVRDILGTPLVASVFHANRWDYAFTIKRQGTAPQQRKLSVFFKDDMFDRVEAEELPSESEFAEKLTTNRSENIKVPELKASEQDLEKFRKASPAPVAADAPVDASGPAKTYPPLEPKSP